MDPITVHVAGTPQGPVQDCVACGFRLTDNTAWFEGRAEVPEGQEDSGPGWWRAGALVATDKDPAAQTASITYVVEGRELDDDERSCT